MKKKTVLLLFSTAALVLSACGAAEENNTSADDSETSPGVSSIEETTSDNGGENIEEDRENTAEGTEETGSRRISVRFGENTVIYELNDSPAADSLYEQLPITTEVEDFSTNEKIFYPSRKLDTSDTPVAESGAGTLAYYAPWGDVVMFYDDYSVNTSLFELGQAVSGEGQIEEMSGTIVIDTVDTGAENND